MIADNPVRRPFVPRARCAGLCRPLPVAQQRRADIALIHRHAAGDVALHPGTRNLQAARIRVLRPVIRWRVD
jgi:hypothetical protein